MTTVLVINSGSSSLKYRLIDVEAGEALATGLVERIGQRHGRATHEDAEGRETSEELVVRDHDAAEVRACGDRVPDTPLHAFERAPGRDLEPRRPQRLRAAGPKP